MKHSFTEYCKVKETFYFYSTGKDVLGIFLAVSIPKKECTLTQLFLRWGFWWRRKSNKFEVKQSIAYCIICPKIYVCFRTLIFWLGSSVTLYLVRPCACKQINGKSSLRYVIFQVTYIWTTYHNLFLPKFLIARQHLKALALMSTSFMLFTLLKIKPFTPEPPVTALADPPPLCSLWRHQVKWSMTTFSATFCSGRCTSRPTKVHGLNCLCAFQSWHGRVSISWERWIKTRDQNPVSFSEKHYGGERFGEFSRSHIGLRSLLLAS